MQKIIYLPGWLNPAENLRPLAELVGKNFDLIDMPMDSFRTVSDFADLIAERIKEPVYIVGHSIGGKIAIATAVRHPDKVKGIFVVSGSNQGKLLFRLLKPAIKLAKLLGFSGRRFQSSDYRDLPEVAKIIMQKTLSFNIVPFTKKVKCPAVFIYGSLDKVTTPALGKKLAELSNGKFQELKGFNHNSIITDGMYQLASVIKSNL